MGSMRRLGWACAPLLTGALTLGMLGAGPGAASDNDARAVAAPTSQGSWGTPIRLMNSVDGLGFYNYETWNGVGVAMDGEGNGVAFSALDYVPGVDEQGQLARLPKGNSQANLIMRYVDGAWQEPEVIEAPMSNNGFVNTQVHGATTSPAVAVSEDGYAAIVIRGQVDDPVIGFRTSIFMSTSHDITEAGSFTPWREVVSEEEIPRYGWIALTDRLPLAVGRGGNIITGYTIQYPVNSCFASSNVRAGQIREGGVSLNPPRKVAECHIASNGLTRSPIDMAISGTTATVAYQEGTPGCTQVSRFELDCTQVEMQTLNMATGAWSSPVRALPQATTEYLKDDGTFGFNFRYEHVRVAASSGGTAVVARTNAGNPNHWDGYYINIPAGTTPDVSTAQRLQAQEISEASTTSHYLSDVVISSDGRALAAYDVETCEVWVYLGCTQNYRRSFQVLEFTPTTSTMHEVTPAVTTNWYSQSSNRIAMSLPPDAPLSRAAIAYTRSGSLVDDVQQRSWIETRAWPLAEATRNIVPAPQGYGTTPDAWHWAAPAVAASATGAALVLYRPFNNASDGVGRSATQEVWVSGLNTANQAGVFPPLHVQARVEADQRISVTGMRPFFYPEGGGEETFFNRGAQPRAKMEVLVKTGPPGYRVTDTPICTTAFARDAPDSSRANSFRGRGTCAITADLPSGTYTFVARTSLDGRVSTPSAPSAPLTYTAPAAQQTITLTRLKAIGKGARVKFQIKGTATGFTDGDTLDIWRKVGSATNFTTFNFTISLGKPDRQGKQAFTYTTKGKHLKPISIFVSSSNGGVRSNTRTIK